MTAAFHRLPNEAVFDGGMVTDSVRFPPDLSYRIRDELSMRTDDVLIVTYPKAGTTWMQEIAYLVNNDGDIAKAKSLPLIVRSRFLEIRRPGEGAGLDLANQDPSPRILKSHLPVRYFARPLEEGKGKFIVVMRNPKDTWVSYYHFYQNEAYGNFPGTWSDYYEMCKAKHLQYGDMFEWNTGWWQHKNNNNILFVKYEDMKKDIRDVIRQVAQHCGKSLDAEVLERIIGHVSMENMKKNPAVNLELLPNTSIKTFMRKGLVGDWKNYFSAEQSDYVEKRCKEWYQPVGLEFEYE